MLDPQKMPAVTLQPGRKVHGFTVQSVTPLAEVRGVAYLLRHEASGARLMHLHTDDPENLMAVAFRTPPPDDTGLPHILEHTVLCGSRRFPVKDPFVELLKTSLATFLNAFTGPDCTIYPCASMNEKDFYNLAEVYCDAVFHPLITPEHFRQEGHHLAFAEPGNLESPLVVKGIVYNEMKGVYSDLDGIIGRAIGKHLCPDNAYGRDFGGDPDVIPSLTYEQFRAFHATYYHPSNARFFLYGNLPTQRHLEFLDRRVLAPFGRIDVRTEIGPQPRWTAPRRASIPYPVGAAEDTARKTAVVMAWLTCDISDAVSVLAMDVLDYYLLGNAASPLRKALIDSQLGEELTQSGYFDHQRETYFTVGLKGTGPGAAAAVEDLVRSTCARLVAEGLEKDKIEAAFHNIELDSREIGSGYPLEVLERVLSGWLYDVDPVYPLRQNEHLADLRRLYETKPRFFERQLERMIVSNPHCLVLTFTPDPEYIARTDREFSERMAAVKARLAAPELKRVAEEAERLEELQSAPNTPEALATLPRLALSDVPADPFELDTHVESVGGVPLVDTDIFTNGITYVQLAFDVSGIPDDLIDYLPVYTQALRKMGAGGYDYVRMAEREAAATGGVEAGLSVSGIVPDPLHVQPLLTVSSCALDRNVAEMLAILADRVLRCDLTDMKRLKEVVQQARVELRSGLIPSGHQYAAAYAARNLSRNSALLERVGGISEIRLFDRLADGFDAHRDGLVERLSRIRDLLGARGRLTASVAGERSEARRVREWVGGLAAVLRDERPPVESSRFEPVLGTREAIATPADVAYCAAAMPVVGAEHPLAPALLLLGVHLSYGYLWDEIRVKGGAYGARAAYSMLTGLCTLTSYRDPAIRDTFRAFGGVFDYVADRMDLSPSGVEQAVIGTVKTLDRPIRPAAAVGTALARHLAGATPGFRRAFRRRLLSLTGDDIRRAASDILRPAYERAPICVLASREKIEAENRDMGASPLSVTDL